MILKRIWLFYPDAKVFVKKKIILDDLQYIIIIRNSTDLGKKTFSAKKNTGISKNTVEIYYVDKALTVISYKP